jgi:hypothetical protein
VEVILRLAKLYEGVDFQDGEFLSQYFDHHLHLNFMNYNERTPILKETFLSIVDGYNKTPENFVRPDDEVLQLVIDAVDK